MRLAGAVVFGLVGLAGDAAAKPAPKNTIELWIRATGDEAGRRPDGERSRWVDLDGVPTWHVERYDVQYDRLVAYRGISLTGLLERYAPRTSLDLVILHFSNGMAIPVPFRDTAFMKRLDPFIARAMRAGPTAPHQRGVFPPIPKRNVPDDSRPIQFSGNKLVVSERWHPAVPAAQQAKFSPWVHTDTLVGIELCAAAAYDAQFDVDGNASARRGLARYRESCQFCHGVRYVGAKFGWDFVEGTPMYLYAKTAATLYHNVAFKPQNAAERGLMMPALDYMTETDAAELRDWLDAIATQPLPSYAPAKR